MKFFHQLQKVMMFVRIRDKVARLVLELLCNPRISFVFSELIFSAFNASENSFICSCFKDEISLAVAFSDFSLALLVSLLVSL
ncbi:unnamed protein product, partial [Pneumocystis jirovecii]